ncbi:hypothetical protein BGZ60DRAFT_251557 [Tricladium varicosporioides]|nr:hypothetical protein BGZ60DRAFT_251557 [Hymenoscyphus varicosporioides]
MPSKTEDQFPFLSLPSELRIAIYQYAVRWPDFPKVFKKSRPSSQRTIQDGPEMKGRNAFVTPALLLVSRQISSEALSVLYMKPLVLEVPPPYNTAQARPMDIKEYISEATLHNVRFVNLKMNLNDEPQTVKQWRQTVESLLRTWKEENQLEIIEVRSRYSTPSRSMGWTFKEAAHHASVMGLLSRLKVFEEQFPMVFIGEVSEEKI